MLPPPKHHLTITDRSGTQLRGKVVYIQPKEERWQENEAEVHIVTSDWPSPSVYLHNS